METIDLLIPYIEDFLDKGLAYRVPAGADGVEGMSTSTPSPPRTRPGSWHRQRLRARTDGAALGRTRRGPAA
nr:hypothetical protein [Arthrobacter sp. JCM 19049]